MEFAQQYWGYVFVFIAFIISSIIRNHISSVYKMYSMQNIDSGYSGGDAVKKILSANEAHDVSVYPIGSVVCEGYNDKTKIISLSLQNYKRSSVASVAASAHEAGHALQAKEKYTPMIVLSSLKPTLQVASSLLYPVIILSAVTDIFFGSDIFFYLFAAIFLMNLITIPVELNASKRALKELESTGILVEEELCCAKKMLTSASLSYFASALFSFIFTHRMKKR